MANKIICEIGGCCSPVRTRGMCNSHYMKWWRHGDPLHVTVHVERKCLIDGCNEKHHGNGYCSDHNSQWKRNGHPLSRFRSVRGEKVKWLQAHTEFSGDECLIFPFNMGPDGYGTVRIEGIAHRSAHAMLRLSEGEPPTDTHQCAHSCGKGHKGCVNPNHLRWATPLENHQDQILHGTRVKGDTHGMSKLTEKGVVAIRALKGKLIQREIAEQFGVSASHVSGILSRKEWSWLE